jgi:transcriptional regulator with XRE-family HTH domain
MLITAMQFAEWFRSSGLTQQAFADRVGVTQGRIAQLLDGDAPSLALAIKIMDATGGAVTPNDWALDRRPRESVQHQ